MIKLKKKFFRPHYQHGQTLLLVVVLFMIASLGVVSSLIGPVIRTSQNTSQLLTATRNYFAAETGVEDVLYRILTGKTVSASETLNVDGTDIVTTITDVSGGKTINTVGARAGTTRKIEATIATGDGIAFNYGIQVGNGGLEMENNSQVIGNVYANGNINGSNGAAITGSAFAANSAALAADQINTLPLPPPNGFTFGNANGTQDAAQSFQVSVGAPINKVRLYLKKVSTPGNLNVRLVGDASGVPGTDTLTSATLSATLVGTNYAWVDVPFGGNPTLTSGNTYWLVLDGATNAGRYYLWGANTAYTGGAGKIGQYDGSWSNTSPAGLDGYFEIYLGGLTGSIDGMIIGQGGLGDARAHTVNNSTIAGNLYCQQGSGNNQSCDTSQPDPVSQPFPVSDANIADWQADALAGGIITGDYNLNNNATATLGPKKITGQLNIDNGAILTLTGTLWVQGNVLLSNGAQIRLSGSYGSSSGVLGSDGQINISNGAQFSGSGQAGSYVMVVTTSDCGGDGNCGGGRAIQVSNNAGTVILNAQNGYIHFSNNAGAKEATAYKLELEENATITYESGLANVNFVSGPTGGFSIDGWREVP